MILVLFSSEEVASFDDVKRYGTFRSQGTENPAVPLFMGHPVYVQNWIFYLSI